MGDLIKAAASPITGILGGIGAKKGADTQAKYADKSLDLYMRQQNQARADLAPYRNFGLQGMPLMLDAMNSANYDRSAALSDYYRGPEYAMLQSQASGDILAANEAMGGMGATSTGNALASIAPQLGMSHLGYLDAMNADMFNRGANIAGMGQSAAAGSANISAGGASQAANLMMNKGMAKSQQAALPWMIAADQNQRAAEGAGAFADFFGGMFTGGGF